MKKILAVIALGVMMLTASTVVNAEGELTVTQKEYVYNATSTPGSYNLWAFLEVQNTGDEPIERDYCMVQVSDGNGNVAVEEKCYNSFFPTNLQPGETGYFRYTKSVSKIEEESTIANCDFDFYVKKGKVDDARATMGGEIVVSDKADDTKRYYTDIYLTAENESEDTYLQFMFAEALYDQDGKLMYVGTHGYTDFGLLPHQKNLFVFNTSSAYDEIWYAQGRIPTTLAGTGCYAKKR